MARTKSGIDPELKREEIELAACRLFVDKGYESTSMAAVAAAAGVAPNTVYWYYANKDDLLVAVLDRLVGKALADLAERQEDSLSQQFKWMLDEFQRTSRLVSTVHARLEQSERIRDWHDRFHALLEDMLVRQMTAKGMSRAKAATLATVGTFVVEGMLSHPHTAQQLERVVRWLKESGKP